MQYVAKSGSAAEKQLICLFKAISSVARNTSEEIHRNMDQLRRNTFPKHGSRFRSSVSSRVPKEEIFSKTQE